MAEKYLARFARGILDKASGLDDLGLSAAGANRQNIKETYSKLFSVLIEPNSGAAAVPLKCANVITALINAPGNSKYSPFTLFQSLFQTIVAIKLITNSSK